MAVWPYGDDRGTTGKPKYLARVDEALGQHPVKAFVIHEREYVVAPSTAEDEDVGDCPACCNPYAPPPDPVCPGNCAFENFTAATLTATVRCRKNPVFEWRNFIPFCDSWEDMGYTYCTDPTGASSGKLKCEAYTHLPEPRGGPPCGMSVSFYQPLYGGMSWWDVGKVLILGHVPPELDDEHWCDKMKRRIEANAGWGHENTQSCTNHGGPRVVISAGFGRIGTFNNYAGCRPSVSCSDCLGSFPVDANGITNSQCAEQMGGCTCGNCSTLHNPAGPHCSPNTAKDLPGGGYGGWPGDGLWEQTTSVDHLGNISYLGCFGMRGQVSARCLANTTMSWVAKYALHPETPGDPVSEWKTCGELDMDVPSAGQWTQVSGVHPSGVAVRGDSGVWTSAALGLVIPQDSDACKIEIVDSPSHGDPFSNGTCGQCNKSDEIPCPDGSNCDPPYDCPQECVCGQANGVWLEFTGLEFVT